MISENLARTEHLHPGDTMTLNTPSGPKPFVVHSVVIDYSSNQGWMMLDRKWFLAYWQDQLCDAIEIYFADGADETRTLNVVRSRLASMPDMYVSSYDGMRKEMRSATLSVFAYAKAPELISLIVAIMGVIGTMLAAVIDRIREIGMLRAIGATRRQVTMSLMWEAAFLGFSAAFCGVVIGIPLGLVLVKVVGVATSGWSLPYLFAYETALRVSALVVAAAMLAGLLPGQRAAKLDVKEALAFE
jgi:putative ABC transport system permease protein